MPVAMRGNLTLVVALLAVVAASNSASAANCTLLTADEVLQKMNRTGHDGVAAIVGDDVITETDLAQRVALHLALTGAHPNAGELKRIEASALQALKDSKVLLSAAREKNMTVSSAEVDGQLDAMLARARVSKGQLMSLLARVGVTIDTLRAQIAVDIVRRRLKRGEGGLRYGIAGGTCLRPG
jgi:hypothetical protein